MSGDIELTILMPCLNEAETLADCIRAAKKFLEKYAIAGEVLIADNGSTDGSRQIAELNYARVIHVPTRGYGAALIHGINSAAGRYIIMGDADSSYDFVNLMPFLQNLRQGCELVMGNRFRGGIKQGAMPFLNKYLGNPVLSFIGRIFFNSSLGDFHCGLRGFNRESMQQLDLQATGMEFASEMVVKATLQKLRITEVPIILSPDGRSRRPHLRRWRDGWRHLKLLLLLSPRWLFMYPGMALIFCGSLLMLMLSNGPLTVSKFHFDIHTMLFSSMFIIIGFQAIFFFIFANFIAVHNVKLISQQNDFFAKFTSIFTLERGVLLGSFAVLLGLGASVHAFLFWMQSSFGDLIPAQMMRILIPAFTFLIAGVQIIAASFFMSILKLHHHK